MQAGARLFNHRPAVCGAAGLCAGILLCEYTQGILLHLGVCLFAVLALLCVREKQYYPLVFLFALLIGIMRLMLYKYARFPSLPGSLVSFFQYIRTYLVSSCDALFTRHPSLFKSMLWGAGAYGSDVQTLRDVGVAHILALSGLHVSYFTAALFYIIPARNAKARFGFTTGFLSLYCALAGFPASLVRASLMVLCVLSAKRFGRPYDLPSSAAFAAVVILIFAPAQLFDIGFLLSFGAVAGITMLSKAIKPSFRVCGDAFSSSAAVTLGGTAGTLPLCAAFFGRLPLYGLFANLLLVPLVPFALLPGFVACVLYPLFPGIAALIALIADAVMELITGAGVFFTRLPYCVLNVKPPDAIACALYFAALLFVSPYFLATCRTKLICALSCLAVMLCVWIVL